MNQVSGPDIIRGGSSAQWRKSWCAVLQDKYAVTAESQLTGMHGVDQRKDTATTGSAVCWFAIWWLKQGRRNHRVVARTKGSGGGVMSTYRGGTGEVLYSNRCTHAEGGQEQFRVLLEESYYDTGSTG